MESFGDQFRSFALALAMHALLIALVWFGVDWFPKREPVAAGEPVQATLSLSAKDLKAARAMIEKATKQAEAAPRLQPPQPVPEPRPQDSTTPPQPKPQELLDRADTVEQEAVSRLAQEPATQPKMQEQEARHRQEQAELTEQIERQQKAEERQRLLAQYQDLQQRRREAERRTKMEEQRLQQLADVAPTPAPPRPGPAQATTGMHGNDQGLLARYKASMLQTADQNWNHSSAPQLSTCKIRFTQIPGGEVINIEFMQCPYDAEGREFVERALRKTPMPYAGFETVFMRQVELSFCYPREECER